jgi:hypothetical protein
LQVSENGDRLFLFNGRGAQLDYILRVLCVSAMRKIQPRHIHARLQQTPDDARRAAGRADGANDF